MQIKQSTVQPSEKLKAGFNFNYVILKDHSNSNSNIEVTAWRI